MTDFHLHIRQGEPHDVIATDQHGEVHPLNASGEPCATVLDLATLIVQLRDQGAYGDEICRGLLGELPTYRVLTHEETAETGHDCDPGGSFAPAQWRAWCSIRADERLLATLTGRTREIFASAPGCTDWLVDVIEPEVAS